MFMYIYIYIYLYLNNFLACNLICLTCSGSSTTCLTCDSTGYYPYYTQILSTCTSACLSRYYTSGYTCLACDP